MNLIEKEHLFGARNYESTPVVIARAKGSILTDVNGVDYIDMMSAYSAASLGHANPHVLKTLKNQASSLGVTSRAFFNNQLPLFLEKLSELSGLSKSIPMNSGAEAVETALKVARKWGEMKKGIAEHCVEIVVCMNNFHGRTLGIVSFSTEAQYKKNFGPHLPGFTYAQYGDIESLRAAITPNTAAFLVETIQGEAGIILPKDDNYFQEVRRLCDEHNILLMLDEIQCGLSRTGSLFCFEHYRIMPDVLILGKALGGGVYPVSAVCAKSEVMDLIRPGDHGSTFGGNAIASAVALTSLELLSDPALIEQVKELGAWSMSYLSQHLAPYVASGLVVDIRGKGLFIGVEFSSDLPAKKVVNELMSRGVLTKDTHTYTIRLAPALTIKKRQLKAAYDALVMSIAVCSNQKTKIQTAELNEVRDKI